MAGGPNRQWHIGDRGPGAWTDRQPHGQMMQDRTTNDGVLAGVLPPPAAPKLAVQPWVPRMGRDPHDTVTMELALDEPEPLPDDIVVRIAAGMWADVDDEVPWLLLLLKAEADSENVLKKGRMGL